MHRQKGIVMKNDYLCTTGLGAFYSHSYIAQAGLGWVSKGYATPLPVLKKSDMYKILEVCGRFHVLTDCDRPMTIIFNGKEQKIDQANYMKTGLALCGVLRQGETLEQWIRRRLR